MRGTKILAFACSMIVAWNQIPISVVPTYAIEEDELKSVTVEANFVDSMTGRQAYELLCKVLGEHNEI